MRRWMILGLSLSWISVLAACGGKPVLPPEGPTIREIYDTHSVTATSVKAVQLTPPGNRMDQKPLAVSNLKRRFARLYNPTLHLYVYPHLAGSEQLPVPGYYTVFPLYERHEYALPGEPINP